MMIDNAKFDKAHYELEEFCALAGIERFSDLRYFNNTLWNDRTKIINEKDVHGYEHKIESDDVYFIWKQIVRSDGYDDENQVHIYAKYKG